MENKNAGWLIIGLAIIIVGIILLFDSALRGIVESSCTMAHGGDYCPMYDTIKDQTYLALAIAAVLVITGLVLIFSKPKEKIVVKKIKERMPEKKYDVSELNKEEKMIFGIVKENRAVFQADLIEKTGLGKAKMSRIIDRLEGKGFVERKRRGMNNIVVLKEE